jgi:nucleoside-diphosphate-sugar epimerase
VRVFLTGAASHLARALLPGLLASPGITSVTGFDRRPCAYPHPAYIPLRGDVRTANWPALLERQDALIHLAFVVLRGHLPETQMRAINVDASQALFSAAAAMPRVIHLSSASIYGQGEHLDENAPGAPLPGFLYAAHKAELEAWLTRHHPRVVRLRPHVILGPHSQPLLRNLARSPFYPALPVPPHYQAVHEHDVADAILAALQRDAAQGPYNLAHAETFTLQSLARRRWGRLATPVPTALLKAGFGLLHATLGIGGERAWLDGLNASLTLDCRKATRELDWQARRQPLG